MTYQRKKPAPKQNQIDTANRWIEQYQQAINNNNKRLRENIINIFAADYLRNFYDDEIYILICESLDLIDKE